MKLNPEIEQKLKLCVTNIHNAICELENISLEIEEVDQKELNNIYQYLQIAMQRMTKIVKMDELK